MKPVTISFAITREDFMRKAMACMRMQFSPGKRSGIRAAGILMLLAACMIFFQKSFFFLGINWPAVLLMIFAVFLLFLFFPTLELTVRKNAAEQFDAGRCGVTAQTVSFLEDRAEIRAERYQAEIPYSMFTAAFADSDTILLYTAVNECRSIPKRTMNSSEQRQVENLLAGTLKQKFKQEGAREWTK